MRFSDFAGDDDGLTLGSEGSGTASSSPDSYFNIGDSSADNSGTALNTITGTNTPSLSLDTTNSALEQQSLGTTQLTDPTASGIFSSQGDIFDPQASSSTSGGAFGPIPSIASALGLGPAIPGATSSPLLPILLLAGFGLAAWFLLKDDSPKSTLGF